jgi:pimeloyl-ACP methyl ester carboxylesterase
VPRLRLDSVEIYYDVHGAGEPVLLLHDYFGSNATWDSQRRLLSRYFQVISPDLRAHGQSDSGDRRLRIDDFTLDIIALLDALSMRAVHILGISLGAVVALSIAREHPDRVITATACSVPYFGEPGAVRYARRFITEIFPSVETELARRHHSLGPRHARQVLLANFRQDLEERPQDHLDAFERAGEIAAPVLVMCGDRDPVFPVSRAVDLYSALQRGSLAVVPGSGHFPHREMATVFDASLLDFLMRSGNRIAQTEPGTVGEHESRRQPARSGRRRRRAP